MYRLTYYSMFFCLCACQLQSDKDTGDYASWSTVNIDGSWTMAAEEAVRATALAKSQPADISAYCPQYSILRSDERVKFWAGLLSAMAEFESDLKPQTRYTETLRDTQGNNVVSRGLLQISIESANQTRYSCNIKKANDLHDPVTNIRCATKILSRWVLSDGVIASAGSENLGGARYWSVLRSKNNFLAKISDRTANLDFCKL